MTESFAELLEESLLNQQIKTGAIITGTVIDVNSDVVIVHAGLKSEAVIPASQFLNEQGEIEVAVGDEVEVALDAVEDGFGETRLSREKAKRARTWTHSKSIRRQEDRHRHYQAARQGRFYGRDRFRRALSCRGRWSICGPCATRVPRRQGLEFKVIKLDQRRNNVVVSRRAVVEKRIQRRARAAVSIPAGRRHGQGYRQEPHRLRCVRGSWGHRRPAAHHRYGVEACQASVRGGQCRRRTRRQSSASSIARRTRVSLGIKQLGAIRGRLSRGVIRRTRVCSARSRTSPTTVASSRSKRASKVWFTCPRWTGQTRTSTRKGCAGRDEVEVMVLDIDEERRRISLGMKQCKSNPWAELRRTSTSDRVSGQHQIHHGLSACLSACPAASTDWCICPTCPGTVPAKRPCATTRKGEELEADGAGDRSGARKRISLGVKQLDQDPLSVCLVIGASEGQSRQRHRRRSRRAEAPRMELDGGVDGPAAGVRAVSRERVEDARTVLEGRRSEVEARVHRCRPQDGAC